VAAGRAGILQLALALTALAVCHPDSEDAPGTVLSRGIAIAMFLPACWVILREQWSTAPVFSALAALGLLLALLRPVKTVTTLPRLSRRQCLILLPIAGFWIFSLLAPSRFLPVDSTTPANAEEE
jgi:hypothetical protein